MRKKLIGYLFITALLSKPLFAQTQTGIIHGKYANVRDLPTVVNSQIVARAYRGTAVSILETTPEATEVGELTGRWHKVALIEEGTQGWIFDRYVALEGSPQLNQYLSSTSSSLYYYRSDLDKQLADLKESVDKRSIFSQLEKYNFRFLNYLGYKLLAERNVLAIPVLIAFMDPEYAPKNRDDANYTFTWEILQRLTPGILLNNTYADFRSWWEHHWGTIALTVPSYEIATILKKVKEHEDKAYRDVLKQEEATTPQP